MINYKTKYAKDVPNENNNVKLDIDKNKLYKHNIASKTQSTAKKSSQNL